MGEFFTNCVQSKGTTYLEYLTNSGGPDASRTRDLLLARQVLSQLSYGPISYKLLGQSATHLFLIFILLFRAFVRLVASNLKVGQLHIFLPAFYNIGGNLLFQRLFVANIRTFEGVSGDSDGARTRDLLRDRQAF